MQVPGEQTTKPLIGHTPINPDAGQVKMTPSSISNPASLA